MTTETQHIDTQPLTATEQRALSSLRARYRTSRDIFSAQELEHLHFIRWLAKHGWLES